MFQGKVHQLKVPFKVHTELLDNEIRYLNDHTKLKGQSRLLVTGNQHHWAEICFDTRFVSVDL